MVTILSFVRSTLLLLLSIAVLLRMPAEAAPAAVSGGEQALFVIVLQPARAGEEAFDVAKHGGTRKYQLGTRVAVLLPEQAVEGVSRDPRVRYMQRMVIGTPDRSGGGGSPRPEEALAAMVAADDPAAVTNGGNASWTTGDYSYDGSGNITSIGPRTVAGVATTDAFRYDRIGRLHTATVHDGTRSRSVTYQYDAAGNMTGVTTDGVAVSLPVEAATNRLDSSLGISYDAVGNLIESYGARLAYQYDPVGTVTQNRHDVYLYTAADERIAIGEQPWHLDSNSWRWTLRDLRGKVVREFESFGSPVMFNFNAEQRRNVA